MTLLDANNKTNPLRLAVVIPAYKAEFLGAALDSLLAQTCRDFYVYVGDDASPHSLRAICETRRDAGLALAYHRFDENQGTYNLVAQWNRCVQLSKGEEWIWLFSDDDVADPRCVERFFEVAGEIGPEVNVLRFNSITIGRLGEILQPSPPHPPAESVESYAYHRLTFQRKSYAPDHIFRRAAFDRHQGFVPFPFALGSDDASWITFAENGPLTTIPGAVVYWRHSGQNVSHFGAGQAVDKVLALMEFGVWLRKRFAGSRVRFDEWSDPVDVDFEALVQTWFVRNAIRVPRMSLAGTWRFVCELDRRSFGNRYYWMLRFLRRGLRRIRSNFFSHLRRP